MFHQVVLYKNQNNNLKYLILYPHLGNVSVTFNSNKQNTNISMLPAHMFFLELFSNMRIRNINDSIRILNENLNNYSLGFIDTIIESFIISNIINKVGDKYIINMEYEGVKNINLVNIFNQISSNDGIMIQKVYTEIAHTRENILSSVINHLMKKWIV